MNNPIKPTHLSIFIAITLVLIIAAIMLQPQQKTILKQPQRILFQLTDGQVKGFDGILIETRDAWRIESTARSVSTVDSTGQLHTNTVPGQVVILPKSNVNIVNYEKK